MKQRGFRYCPTCNHKLQKRGLTAAGTQRWYCPKCAKSNCRPRPDLERKLLLEHFVKWLLGKESQTEAVTRLGLTTARSWRNKTAWCWDVKPPRILGASMPSSPGIILMDGTRIGHLTNLIARTLDGVIGWQYSPWESSGEWEKLISRIPAPQVAVVDGQKGVLKAIVNCWPSTKIQRCHFHIWMNIRSKLTLHPKTPAGTELLLIARILLKGICSEEQKDQWLHELYSFGIRYKQELRERTYGLTMPSGRRRWWYTHRNLRSAYRQLVKLAESGQLFTYLEEVVVDTDTGNPVPIPRTTNHMEGGINNRLRDLQKLHRGLPVARQIRLADWYLHTRKIRQKPPRNFL
jgi:hypothetical protein